MNLFKEIQYYFKSDKLKRKLLKNILGFYPSNLSLYNQAFMHRSMLIDDNIQKHDSNERLEFLGDAILGTIVSDFFFKKYPYADEGFLTKMRARIVSRTHLNELALKIDLDSLLVKSPNVINSKSIYGDAFEALIGAIYLDKGYATTKQFVEQKVIRDCIDLDTLIIKETNYKSKLIELAQKRKDHLKFITKSHDESELKNYHSEVFLNKLLVGYGEGFTKKEAEQNAAQAFFESK